MYNIAGQDVPLVEWPPLFPLLLAGLASFGVDVYEGARWLNAILFGVCLWLLGNSLLRYARIHWALTLPLMVFAGTHYKFIGLYADTLSEPVFITVSLAGVMFLIDYEDSQRLSILISSAVAFGLAVSTRFFGLALVGGASFCVLSSTGNPLSEDFVAAFCFPRLAYCRSSCSQSAPTA